MHKMSKLRNFKMISIQNYYFIFDKSPWPIIISINLMTSFLSFLLSLKNSEFFMFSLSFMLLTLSCYFWWVSYSKELLSEGKSSFNLEKSIKFGMVLFISSEVFFFFSFFWAYFHFLLVTPVEIGMSWPPQSVAPFEAYQTPLLNTILLLASGVTLTLSHSYFNSGGKNFKKFLMYLSITFILGLLFTCLQYSEYSSSFFNINDSTFGSSFYLLTGFHGIHVIIGTIFLISITFRSYFMNISIHSTIGFELAAWYWHFVDVIWLFVYFLLYYINNL